MKQILSQLSSLFFRHKCFSSHFQTTGYIQLQYFLTLSYSALNCPTKPRISQNFKPQPTRHSLLAGRSGDRIPVLAKFSAPVQTGPRVHPASCLFPGGKKAGTQLNRHTATPLLPLWAFMDCSRVNCTVSYPSTTDINFAIYVFYEVSRPRNWRVHITRCVPISPPLCVYSNCVGLRFVQDAAGREKDCACRESNLCLAEQHTVHTFGHETCRPVDL
jgi:hypothetical protein